MSLNLILQDVELKDNTTNDNTFDVFYDINTGFFHAFENVESGKPRKFSYKLKGNFNTIVKKHSREILEYCLGTVKPNDSVELSDIFLHGKHIEKIRIFSDIELIDEYNGIKKGTFFVVNNKTYRIFGFDIISDDKIQINAQRILKTGMVSRKQPLLEIFDFNKIFSK